MKPLLCWVLLAAFAWPAAAAADLAARQRAEPLRGVRCTYAAPPRLDNGRVDADRLLAQLAELHANTYRWVLHPGATNFEDFQHFLPLANARHLKVWVTINPPSERPKDSRPLAERLAEYQGWAEDFARLSLQQTNFVAWSIDDFVWNLKFFTPEAIRQIVAAARAINPRLAFIPCCYFKGATPAFVKDYGPVCDGIIFPYRDESGGANLTNSAHVASELKLMHEKFGPDRPIILSVFSNRHSKLGSSTPDYVERVLRAAHPDADGLSVYRHPNATADPEKHAIVKRLYTAWSAAP
jgi:hypothetical protein